MGVPPAPVACVSTHTSAASPAAVWPANAMSRSLSSSYAVPAAARGPGPFPAEQSRVHVCPVVLNSVPKYTSCVTAVPSGSDDVHDSGGFSGRPVAPSAGERPAIADGG